MLANLSNILNILTVFQLLVLAYIFKTRERGNGNNHFFLFLVLNAFLFSISVSYTSEIISRDGFPILTFLFYSSFLLLGPLLYFYTKSICFSGYTASKREILHFLPFILLFCYYVTNYFLRNLDNTEKTVFNSLDYSIYSILFIGQLLFYILYSFYVIKKYQLSLKNSFSSTENIDLKWMEILLVFYFFHWFFDASFYFYYLLGVRSTNIYLITGILSTSTLLIFSTMIVVMGLKKSTFFNEVHEKEKYSDSNLSDAESNMYVKELINYMESSKPYLEPSLKITEIAERLSIPPKALSQSINQKLNKNFFDFVNSYRIEEAKERIQQSNGNSNTILEILYDSGFNSKTAFNRAFKKHTGLTPTQFKSLKPE